MSLAYDIANGEPHEKASHKPSLRAIPRQDVADGGGDDLADDSRHGQRNYTRHDRSDMRRMGKIQELRRNFHFCSAVCFTVILQGTCEVLLMATTQGLVDGGLAGLFWSYIWTFIGNGLIVISLAEMASIAPTAGGQYHWVSEFAPPQYQKFLSYFIGWMSSLSWQAGQASGFFLIGTIIQALLTVNDPSYEPTRWQGTLFVFAVSLVIFILNVWGANAIPMVNILLFLVHVITFIAIITTLWVKSPHNTARVVFTQFTNGGGWSSTGLSLMVGQISAIYGLTCSDGAAHLSEEIKDAGLNVPRAILGSYLINGSLGLVTLVTYLFCITDLDAALKDPSTYPFLHVLRTTLPQSGMNALSIAVLIILFASTVSFNISTSRQTWSFARDRGFPFSQWIARVNSHRQLPVNAIGLSCAVTALLALINIGSSVAFNAIISLMLVSLMFSYFTSISCVLWRRLYYPESLPPARWSLGRWGVPINAAGMTYALFAFFWCFWPNGTPVDATSFNWAPVMFLGLAAISLVFYWVEGRKVFKGPVVLVQDWRPAPEK